MSKEFNAVFCPQNQSEEAAKFGDPIPLQGLSANSPKSLAHVMRSIDEHTKPKERILIVTTGDGMKLIDSWLKEGSPKEMKRSIHVVTRKGFSPGQLYRMGAKGLESGDDEGPGQFCMMAG